MDDQRTIYSDRDITVIAYMTDDDLRTLDGDCYSKANAEAFDHGDWRYVVLRVVVELGGVAIGEASVGAVAHGDMGDDFTADAWEWFPAVVWPHSIYGGSPLYETAAEAVTYAADWWEKHVGPVMPGSAIARVQRHVEPTRPEEIEELHERAIHENQRRDAGDAPAHGPRSVKEIAHRLRPLVAEYRTVLARYEHECETDGDASDRTMQDRDDAAVAVAEWVPELLEALDSPVVTPGGPVSWRTRAHPAADRPEPLGMEEMRWR